MPDRAVFYQLTTKYVSDQHTIPEQSRQVLYYTLAIGHHVGVMDCFKSVLEIPLADYRGWIDRLPEGPARQKLAGLLKWGEIEINRSHVAALLPALRSALPTASADEAQWTNILTASLEQMVHEPALYLMVRKRS